MAGRIIKSKIESRFTTIPNSLLRRKDLSLKAKGLICFLLSLPEDWKVYKTCLPDMLKEGREAIDSAFEELETTGYINKKVVRADGGKFDGHDYVISSEPLTGDSEEIKPPLRETRQRLTRSGKPAATKKEETKKEQKEDTIVSQKNEPEIIYEKGDKEKIDSLSNWIQKNSPRVMKMKQPLTEAQLLRLVRGWSPETVREILLSMQNHAELTKKYVSTYLTFMNWARRGNTAIKQASQPKTRQFKNPPKDGFFPLDDNHPLWTIADQFGNIDYSKKSLLPRPTGILEENGLIVALFDGGKRQPLGARQVEQWKNKTLKTTDIFYGIII